MSIRKKDYMTVGLCIALGFAILIIVYLVYNKSSKSAPVPHHALPPPPARKQAPPPANPPALVKFYADWCGACKTMAPEWEKAKPVMGKMVQVLEIEGTKHAEEIKKHGIAGFPTIRLYPEGFPSANYIEYKGNRTSDSLLKFVSSRGQQEN